MDHLRWGSLEFDGGVSLHTPYTLAWVTGFGGVGVKRDSASREGAHGNFPAPGFLEAREIKWGGLILTKSDTDQEHAIRALSGKRGLAAPARLVAQGADVRWVDVERADIPDPVIVVPGRIASYQCSVVAPDSLIYGETFTYGPGTSLSVFHYGSADAVPEVTVTGAMPSGYRVNGPNGEQFIVSQALAAGQTHRIDFSTGWLYRNGALQQGGVSRAQTWVIPPGSPSVMSLTPVSGAGQLTVKVPDTFS